MFRCFVPRHLTITLLVASLLEEISKYSSTQRLEPKYSGLNPGFTIHSFGVHSVSQLSHLLSALSGSLGKVVS